MGFFALALKMHCHAIQLLQSVAIFLDQHKESTFYGDRPRRVYGVGAEFELIIVRAWSPAF